MLLVGLGVAYVISGDFALYSRHHLVTQAPEEEFEAIQKAAAELA